ncbi:MAG: pyruvate/2-oxoglutarate dehydrogenase complex dihydrolipoamide acyltransferase (E2) component [Halieaceae bacterium]|jgi:pyruvate/2-oxoglutarate dehydrogenase complex dihydrolipoamide acyltransferase (E2) component
MRVTLKLPKLGQSMQAGTILEWLVRDGEDVTEGQPLYILESEKTAMEIECPYSGTISELCVPSEGIAVGTPIAVIDRRPPKP